MATKVPFSEIENSYKDTVKSYSLSLEEMISVGMRDVRDDEDASLEMAKVLQSAVEDGSVETRTSDIVEEDGIPISKVLPTLILNTTLPWTYLGYTAGEPLEGIPTVDEEWIITNATPDPERIYNGLQAGKVVYRFEVDEVENKAVAIPMGKLSMDGKTWYPSNEAKMIASITEARIKSFRNLQETQ